MINVSVIIPTYGKPDYLGKAIDSVLNQTLPEVELIVVDDNNPETIERKETEKVVSKYGCRIVYLKHERNKNGAAARNTGIAKAKGKYIAFLDSDDEYDLNRLKLCFDALEKADSKYGAVYTGCSFFRNNKHYRDYTQIETGNFLRETLACEFAFCTGSNIFMRAEIVKEIGGFDECFIRHQDYEFLVRFFEKYEMIAIPQIYVRKNEDFRNLPSINKVISVKEQFLNKYRYLIDKYDEKIRNEIIAAHYYQIACLAVEHNNKQVYRQYKKKFKSLSAHDVKKRMKMEMMILRNVLSR